MLTYNYYHVTLCTSMVLACPPVILVYYIEMVSHIIRPFSQLGSPIILVFPHYV